MIDLGVFAYGKIVKFLSIVWCAKAETFGKLVTLYIC